MTRSALLGELELMVMLAVVRLDGGAYGVPISRELLEIAGREVALGSIYAALERLEEKGLVASALGEPTAERGGRAKRYFEVTPAGLEAIEQTKSALQKLWSGVRKLRGRLA